MMRNSRKNQNFHRLSILSVIGVIILLITCMFVPFCTIIKGDTVSGAEWDVWLKIEETGGKSYNVTFGESINASDGPPYDSFDAPIPPSPPWPPYIQAWFDDGLSYPYNKLINDFRLFSVYNTYKVWNLTVEWVNDSGNGTNINISWNITEFDNCEYDTVILWDSDDEILCAEMKTENTPYNFTAENGINNNFQIIANTTYNPPKIPSNPVPNNGATGVGINADLSWTGGDINPTDIVTYDVYFEAGDVTPDVLVSGDQNGTSYDPGALGYNTVYYWKIIAWDEHDNFTEGPIWSFETKGQTTDPPVDPPTNQLPVANASASDTSGFIGMNISFNGSLSYDPDEDGSIVSWDWNFGDDQEGTGETTIHRFYTEDTFTVTLTVTDNRGGTGTDTINVTIIQGPNLPPTKPEVTGPLMGHKDIIYTYTANATDLDNNTISYIFTWGDGNIFKTEFLPVGVLTTQNKSWNSAGRYVLTVEATDNHTYSETTELIIMIDAIDIGDIGYFTDNDGDGIYDTFHGVDATTGLTQDDEGNYLIDTTGNGEADYVYNIETGELTEYQAESESQIEDYMMYYIILAAFIIIIGGGSVYYLVIMKKTKKQTKKTTKEKSDKK